MLRSLLPVLCVLVVLPSVTNADEKSAAYLLNPGDVLSVSVWREDTLKSEVQVLPDGSITFPLVGRVKVAGLDSTAVEKDIAQKLEKFLPDPIVSVVITNPKGNLVYVQGKVLKPGPLQLAGPTDVLQILSQAGGLDKFADKKGIKILRDNKVLPVHYSDLIDGSDMSTNHKLQVGDTLVVP
ncbi:polysaccharide biosynthesis/export family protein [Pseudomonas arsenicoxydans]|uniref:Sugar ABC transporter substrate-binding protein n=1 Tax=Pseudomonas arsenicoxydans TaxID=702115 RepID=A0A502HQD7_9PSED|nr:polysaccharide biosynthesis/export family protein [Pseudomonas arsenicoxydans]TPG75398.1 sugar ABC transporter substrate-binding protein [Pseudomonas arsenicoxydans]